MTRQRPRRAGGGDDRQAPSGWNVAPGGRDVEANGSFEVLPTAAEQLPPDALRAQLQRILCSPAFEASERQKRFLRYVVDELLAGRAERLKGYSIALAVFDRDDTFDPQTDPVVRLEARRLRRALEHYYLTAGRGDPVRIEIPKGGYAPVWERQDGAPVASFSPPRAGTGSAAEAPTAIHRARRRWLATAGVAALLGAALALAVTTASPWLTRAVADRSGAQTAAEPQLEGPAVVIAPFKNLSGTEAGRLFAGGFTQELITDLMRFKDLRVYSANGNQRWMDDPGGFGQQLQVGYEVKGSVLRAPDRLRLAVQLLELGSGRYLWSERYDSPLTTESIFDVQETIAAELAGRLAEPYGVIHAVTADLFRQHRPDTLFAYDCVLQAFAYRRTYSPELYASTRTCLEQAVRDDPGYPVAWAMLAFAHLDEYRWYGWGPLYRQTAALDQALGAAQRALELDPDDVMSLSALAAVQFYRGAFAEAERAQRQAVDLNPNNPELLAQLGWRIAFAADWQAGMALVRQAAQRSMAERGWYYLWLAIDDYRRGDYRSARANLDRLGGPFFFLGPALVAMCEAQLGHLQQARAALDQARAVDPSFADDPAGAFRLHRAPEDLIELFLDGLRKAGLGNPAT